MEWLQQLINGISLGSIYALIALGYTMVYGIIKLINFAHGEIFMIGAFIGYLLHCWYGAWIFPRTYYYRWLPVQLLVFLLNGLPIKDYGMQQELPH